MSDTQNGDTKRTVLRNGELIGTIDCPFLAIQIDGLTIHNTAVEPFGKYEYEVVEQGGGSDE